MLIARIEELEGEADLEELEGKLRRSGRDEVEG